MRTLTRIAELLGFDPNDSLASASLAGRRYGVTAIAGTVLSTGDAYIDGQHSLLVALIGRLHDVTVGTARHGEFMDLLREVRKYLEFHFLSEENLLRAARVEGLLEHAKEHSDMLNELSALTARVQNDRVSARAVRDFLIAWLSDHVRHEAEHLRALLNKANAAADLPASCTSSRCRSTCLS